MAMVLLEKADAYAVFHSLNSLYLSLLITQPDNVDTLRGCATIEAYYNLYIVSTRTGLWWFISQLQSMSWCSMLEHNVCGAISSQSIASSVAAFT